MLLTKVVDTLEREILYFYSADTPARLEQIVDFTGRVVSYGYDGDGNLVSVTGPEVTTPGNAFAGKTERFEYEDPQDPHNLTAIVRPNQNVGAGEQGATDATGNGTPTTEIVYDGEDRVAEEFWGSGTVYYTYEAFSRPAVPGRHDEVVARTIVRDRNQNVAHYWFNDQDRWTAKLEFVDATTSFDTYREHDGDGQILVETLPRGARTQRVYDDGVVILDDGSIFEDARQRANAIVTLVWPAEGRDEEGDYDIETDQPVRIAATVFDTIYNQPCIRFEPRAFAEAGELGEVLDWAGKAQTQRFGNRIFFDYEEGVLTMLRKRGNPMTARAFG